MTPSYRTSLDQQVTCVSMVDLECWEQGLFTQSLNVFTTLTLYQIHRTVHLLWITTRLLSLLFFKEYSIKEENSLALLLLTSAFTLKVVDLDC